MRNYMTSSQDCDDDVNDDGYLKQTPFILQWSIRFRGGSEEPHRARTITLVWSWLDENGGAFVFLHLSIIFIGRFSLLSIKEEEVYHLFWNGNISTQNTSISNWSPPSEEAKYCFWAVFRLSNYVCVVNWIFDIIKEECIVSKKLILCKKNSHKRFISILSHNSENEFQGRQSSKAILSDEWPLCILCITQLWSQFANRFQDRAILSEERLPEMWYLSIIWILRATRKPFRDLGIFWKWTAMEPFMKLFQRTAGFYLYLYFYLSSYL